MNGSLNAGWGLQWQLWKELSNRIQCEIDEHQCWSLPEHSPEKLLWQHHWMWLLRSWNWFVKFWPVFINDYWNQAFFCALVCETSFHTVEEEIPQCEQSSVEHCYDGISGRQCHNVSNTECKLVRQNVTKYYSPDIDVRKLALCT